MKISSGMRIALLAAVLIAPSLADAMVVWSGKSVGRLSAAYDGADCTYFTLEGVTEADPVKPGDPLFAFPRTQFGSKDGYAMLLTAKVSGQTVTVITRGTLSCGYAAVAEILLQ